MKIEKLLKKISKFFTAEEKNSKQNKKRKDDLIFALDKKISSMKDKVKDLKDKDKINEIKRELEVLQNIRKKI